MRKRIMATNNANFSSDQSAALSSESDSNKGSSSSSSTSNDEDKEESEETPEEYNLPKNSQNRVGRWTH